MKEFPLGTYGQADGTKIEWKEGNDLAEKVLKKQPKDKEPEKFKSAQFVGETTFLFRMIYSNQDSSS